MNRSEPPLGQSAATVLQRCSKESALDGVGRGVVYARQDVRVGVERRPDPRDGRARIVVSTEAGRRGIAAAAGILAGAEAGLAERMGEERLGSLVVMLEELGSVLAHTSNPSEVQE